MKKLISILGMLVLSVTMLTGCDGGVAEAGDNGRLSIVTTIFPEYDWVREITKGNENVEITMLLDNGVDLHSFQPTVDDIVKLSSCDMFIYVGGESDRWVEDALTEATNKDMTVINLLDVLGDSVKEEELVEGMETKEDESEEEEGPEYDEHVWLSLKNAEVLCEYISDELCRIDPANEAVYEANMESYISQLDALDKEYEAVVSNASVNTVLFGDRFPFRYLADDYGLEYYAAFAGCSAEAEASFETITFLANKLDELELPAILQIESADGKISQTVRDTTADKDQQILTMDSMQSVAAKDVEEGTTFLGIMKSNLEVLGQALN